MISRELEAQILRLYHAEHWPIGTLARQLGIHHDTVRRVLTQAGIPAAKQSTRPSMADPFVPFIQARLAEYPTLRASRLYRARLSRSPRSLPRDRRSLPAAEAYLRLRKIGLPHETGDNYLDMHRLRWAG
jgi:hypothetical protein